MPLAWMGAPPPQGPSFLGLLGMEGILHSQFLSGSGGDRSFKGEGHFYGPNYLLHDSLAPGPPGNVGSSCWLSCGPSWHSPKRWLATCGTAPMFLGSSVFCILSSGLGQAGPSALRIQGQKHFVPLPCWPYASPGLPFHCLSPTISNVATIQRPFTVTPDFGEGHTCRRHPALLFPEKLLRPSSQMVMGQALREPLIFLAVFCELRHQKIVI